MMDRMAPEKRFGTPWGLRGSIPTLTPRCGAMVRDVATLAAFSFGRYHQLPRCIVPGSRIKSARPANSHSAKTSAYMLTSPVMRLAAGREVKMEIRDQFA